MYKIVLFFLFLFYSVSLCATTYDAFFIKQTDNIAILQEDINIEGNYKDIDEKNDLYISKNNDTDLLLLVDAKNVNEWSIENNKLVIKPKDIQGNYLKEKIYVQKIEIPIVDNNYNNALNYALDGLSAPYLTTQDNIMTTLISKEIIDIRKINDKSLLVTLLVNISENYDKDKIIKNFEYKALSPFEIDENNVLLAYNGISKNIIIPEGVVEIGDTVFANMKQLESVTLPKSLKKIGCAAFAYCNNLNRIDLSNVEFIKENAFRDCINLENVNFSSNIKEIGYGAFYNCNLKRIIIPGSLKKIENGTFFNNENIEMIILKDGIEEIESNAFRTNTNTKLFTLSFPKSIKKIGGSAFEGYIALKSISFSEGLESIGYCAFSCSEKEPNKVLDNLYFPNSLKEILSGAFQFFPSLSTIRFGNNLEYIGRCAFYNTGRNQNKNLKELEFPASLKIIEDQAFHYYRNLHKITFYPNDVLEKIGSWAFSYPLSTEDDIIEFHKKDSRPLIVSNLSKKTELGQEVFYPNSVNRR